MEEAVGKEMGEEEVVAEVGEEEGVAEVGEEVGVVTEEVVVEETIQRVEVAEAE